MTEHQNIEYKQSWCDEYLKWVCGFANANGGTIYIGKDDLGKVVGVSEYKKLMEDIPNKIHDILGVMAEVNLKKEDKLHFIEIVVPAYSVPISFRGRYYYRMGSTKRELTGSALNEFLLKKAGKTWDEVVEPSAKLSDIDKKSVQIFLKSADQAKRFPADEKLPLKELLSKLQLMERGRLRRAAIVLFAKEPGQFFPSMRVQIGRFGDSKVELRFQESIEGNLIHCLQQSIEELYHKFFIRVVSFEGIHRIEKWQYPLDAIREVLLNALIHKNYMGAHIQFEVYDDRIRCWNEGKLPEEVPVESLKKRHSSKPRNPFIASACFKGGYIDAWGRGIKKIMDACKNEGLPEPEFEETCGGLSVTLFGHKLSARKPESKADMEVTTEVTMEVTTEVNKLLKVIDGEQSKQELRDLLGLKNDEHFRKAYLVPAIEVGLVEMTIPDKPKSSKQKYRLTEKGKKILKTGT